MFIEDGVYLSPKLIKQILILSKIDIVNNRFTLQIVFETGNGTTKQILSYAKKTKAIEERDLLIAEIEGKAPPKKKSGFPIPGGGSQSIN